MYKYLTAIFLILMSFPVFTHEISPAIIDLDINQQGEVQVSISTNLEALMAGIGPEHKDTDTSPNAKEYNALRSKSSEELAVEFKAFETRLLEGIRLNINNKPSMLAVKDIEVDEIGDVSIARTSKILLAGEVNEAINTLSWQLNERFGANALRVSTAQKQDIYTVYLQAGESSAIVDVNNTSPQSVWSVINNYLVIGFTHILPKGLDHILFVVGLFLLSTKLSSLLIQVTSFTLAHTVTLALGMLGIITLSPAIVEPLIAASIVYVAIENILSDKLNRWRPLLVFAFGLLHGLGFAGVLTEIGLSDAQFVTGLIAFNVGVELGQLTVILICFLAIGYWFSGKPWYRKRVTIPLSVLIALIGCYWFVERTLLS